MTLAAVAAVLHRPAAGTGRAGCGGRDAAGAGQTGEDLSPGRLEPAGDVHRAVHRGPCLPDGCRGRLGHRQLDLAARPSDRSAEPGVGRACRTWSATCRPCCCWSRWPQAVPEANRETAWLALAMSSTFAGNLTVLGSVANLIVVENAGREGVGDFVLGVLQGRHPADFAHAGIGNRLAAIRSLLRRRNDAKNAGRLFYWICRCLWVVGRHRFGILLRSENEAESSGAAAPIHGSAAVGWDLGHRDGTVLAL